MNKTLIALVVASLLSGCANTAIERNRSAVDENKKQAERLLATMRPAEPPAVAFSDASYIPLKKMERAEWTISQKALLAKEIETNRTFLNLNEVASWLASVGSAPVFLNPELMVQTPMPGMGGVGAPVGMPAPMPMPGQVGAPGQFGVGLMSTANRQFSVTYSGSISGFLDMVAAHYGIFWKLEQQNIRFLLTDSRTFRIKALPGDTQLQSTVGSTSNSGSAGGSSTTASTSTGSSSNTTGVSFTGLSVWAGIETGIKQLLTPVTGKVAVSPSTGTVSVTDTPRVLDRVAEFVREQNASLGRQVSVNVRVLSVEITDSDNYGINWNAVYTSIADNAVFKVNSAFTAATGAANFVLQTNSPSTNNWGAASGAIISALSTQGRVSELTSATMVTLNNQPAPVNVGRQVSYLASSATTQAANAGTTTTLTPGQVQTGFSMVLVPHILDGKELLLQSSINLSSLLQMATITSGGSSIQSPDLSTSNFIQRVKMGSGDVLVVAGFDQDKLSAVSNGIGSANNPFLGNRDANGKRAMLVILIQPTVTL